MRIICFLILLCGLVFAAENYTICTSPTVSHPQLAWLVAERSGALESVGTFTRKNWNSQVEFQALLTEGKADLWLGSVEAMARARQSGCKIKILIITGWQKWYLIGKRYLTTNSALKHNVDTAPKGNPAAAVLRQCFPGKVYVHFVSLQSLAMQIMDNKVSVALLPEPFATQVLKRNSSLKRIVSLERLKAQRLGGKERIPWAAIAVNENSPLYKEVANGGKNGQKKLDVIISALMDSRESMKLMARDSLSAVWPVEYEKTIPRTILKDSLPGDKYTLDCTPAAQAVDEVKEYLKIVAPELLADKEFLSGLIYVPQK